MALRPAGILYVADNINDIQSSFLTAPAGSKNYYLCMADGKVYEKNMNNVFETQDLMQFIPAPQNNKSGIDSLQVLKEINKKVEFLLSTYNPAIIPPEILQAINLNEV